MRMFECVCVCVFLRITVFFDPIFSFLFFWGAVMYVCLSVSVCMCVYVYVCMCVGEQYLQSLDIPTARHFLKRQY